SITSQVIESRLCVFYRGVAWNHSHSTKVGVEMIIAEHPLHRSGRAALPHPAPTLGDDAQAHEGIGRTQIRPPGWDGLVQATPEFGFDLSQLPLPPRAHRLAQHREPALARLPA